MIWLFVGLAIYLFILFIIAWISLHPYRIPVFLSPGGLGCSQEEVEFTTHDGITLRGWWVDPNAQTPSCLHASSPETPQHRNTVTPATTPPGVVAIVSHGYMMNRSELSPLAPLFASKGIASLYYDFRAHGRSAGKKSYLGFRERYDVAAAVAFARFRAPGCKIILIGSSMGAAASAMAAGQDPTIDALILDCAYSRLPNAVLGWWRFLGGRTLAAILSPTPILCMPMAGFNPYKVDVSDSLRNTGNMPVLFFHGEKDNLALPSEAERNRAACQGPTKIVWFPNCGHAEGRWIYPTIYNAELVAFLEEHVLR